MELQKMVNQAARIMQGEFKRQAPKATGKLRASIKVRAKVTEKGVIFTTDYLPYGIYTDKGTGPYHTKRAGEWNPKPGKGRGGIKPRHWTSLSSTTRTTLKSLIIKGLTQDAAREIRTTFKTALKK